MFPESKNVCSILDVSLLNLHSNKLLKNNNKNTIYQKIIVISSMTFYLGKRQKEKVRIVRDNIMTQREIETAILQIIVNKISHKFCLHTLMVRICSNRYNS